jgi:hypothetical protein
VPKASLHLPNLEDHLCNSNAGRLVHLNVSRSKPSQNAHHLSRSKFPHCGNFLGIRPSALAPRFVAPAAFLSGAGQRRALGRRMSEQNKVHFWTTRSGAGRIVTSDVLTDVDDSRLSTAFGRFSFEKRRCAVRPMSADSAIFLKMDDDLPVQPSLSEWQRSLQRLAAWMTRGNRVREQSRPATPIRAEQSGRSSDAPRRPIPPRP